MVRAERSDDGTAWVAGKGEKGATVRASFYFPTDPGYRDTARMLTESGLTLALQSPVSECGTGAAIRVSWQWPYYMVCGM